MKKFRKGQKFIVEGGRSIAKQLKHGQIITIGKVMGINSQIGEIEHDTLAFRVTYRRGIPGIYGGGNRVPLYALRPYKERTTRYYLNKAYRQLTQKWVGDGLSKKAQRHWCRLHAGYFHQEAEKVMKDDNPDWKPNYPDVLEWAREDLGCW